MQKNGVHFSRRSFLGGMAAMGAASMVPARVFGADKPNSLFGGVQVGVITYSYRSMPDKSAEAVLQYVVNSGISSIELMPLLTTCCSTASAPPGIER